MGKYFLSFAVGASLLVSQAYAASGDICIQVLQSAKNPLTQECKTFSTPCDVPEGWTTTNSCDTTAS